MIESPLKPWAASQWVTCPGSVLMQAQFPALPGEVSRSRIEGRACHWVAQGMLEDYATPDPNRSCVVIGTQDPDGTVITNEMYAAAVDYATEIMSVVNPRKLKQHLRVEQKVALDMVFPGVYGYCDAWLWDSENRELFVWEGKFGRKWVDAFENYQMIMYVLGILEALEVDGCMDQRITVHMKVYQPLAFHPDGPCDTWTVTASDLRAYFNTVKAAANEAFSGNAKCVASLHCYKCSARWNCPANQGAAQLGMQYIHDATALNIDPHSIGVELRLLKRAKQAIEDRLSGLEEQAIHMIRNGQAISHFTAKSGKGRRKWTQPADQVFALGDMLGHDLRGEQNPITPTQAVKLGIDDAVISAYTETPSTGFKLVADNKSKLKKVFKR